MSTRVGARPGSGRLRFRTVIKLAVPSNVRLRISDRDFWQLCQENRDLRMERSEQGVLEVMPPTSGGTGARNADLTAQVVVWAKIDGTGNTF
jgi:Uma2 family endonuclease